MLEYGRKEVSVEVSIDSRWTVPQFMGQAFSCGLSGALSCELVSAFVLGMPGVPLDVRPGHRVRSGRRLEPTPQRDVLDGRTLRSLPAVALPALDPQRDP